jgi:hypothetical protein
VRYAFLKLPRLQLPNERVSFGAPSYVGWGHSGILNPTSPLPSNQSIAKIVWNADEQLRRGGTRKLSSGRTIPFSAGAATEASAAVQRRRHGGGRDCTPGAGLPPSSPRRSTSAGAARSSIPFSSVSRFMDFRESRPKFLPPQFLSTMTDIPHYESLLVVEMPETSDAVVMIHNIIRGAHSFWL